MYLNTQYRGMYLTLLVALVIGLASVSGALRYAQGWAYDQFVNVAPLNRYDINQVVIVDLPAQGSALNETDWVQLLDTINKLGTVQVVLGELPLEAGSAFFQQLHQIPNLVIGRTPKGQVDDDTDVVLNPLPARFSATGVSFGIQSLPLADHGISRYFAPGATGKEAVLQPLALAAAVARGQSLPELSNNRYRVNFYDGRHRIPRVSAAHVLDNALIPELFVGRSVLIGTLPDQSEPGIYTPYRRAADSLSLLDFQAYELETLMGNRAIYVTGFLWLFALLLLSALASLFIYQWVDVRTGGWFTVALVLCYWATGWSLLHFFYIWMPVLELSLTQIILYLLIGRLKDAVSENALREMIAESSSRLQASAAPDSFYNSQEHWTQVVTLIDQVLHLRRLIFLEKVVGDHRVREVKALNCSIDVIDERRRDYERTPYSTAIEEGGPILLEKQYLKPPDNAEEEDVYLVPLIFAEEVLGFWAFGVAPVNQAASARFLETVAVFASQISELLYHRGRWLEQQDEEANVLRRFLRLEGGDPAYPQLRRFVEMAHRRVSGMEGVFNGLDTAAIVYDLFGRVLHLNRHMESFMQTRDLPGYEMTALDLLVHLTDSDPELARQLLQEVVMDNGQFRLPVTLQQDLSKNYILVVHAISRGEQSGEVNDSAVPFKISGILFELVNFSQLQGVYSMKDTLVERFGRRMRGDLAGIVLSADLLRDESISQRDRERVAAVLEEKASSAVDLINRARTYMQVSVAGASLGLYPIDAGEPLALAIHSLKEEAGARGIEFSLQLPEFSSLVRASPEDLGRLMHLLLEALVNDAAENTVIEINVEESKEQLVYKFSNTGFGIPNERFQAYLFGGKNTVAEEFRALHVAIDLIRASDGYVSAHSEVGTGMAFSLELQVVI